MRGGNFALSSNGKAGDCRFSFLASAPAARTGSACVSERFHPEVSGRCAFAKM